MDSFDVVVIGAGPAGEVAAGRLADDGLAVAIVEDRLVGGECSFWACMPSKALLRPYEALAEVKPGPRRGGGRDRRAGRAGGAAQAATRSSTTSTTRRSCRGSRTRASRSSAAAGKVVGERRVDVELNDGGSAELEAGKAVFVAGGTAPKMPPIEGLDQVTDAWTNREATTTKEIPESMVIMGGGVVGVEMAQAYTSLGCKVSLVEGRAQDAPARGGVRLRAGHRVADRAGRRTSAPARRRRRSPRTAAKVTVTLDRRLARRAATCCSSRSAARRRSSTMGLEDTRLRDGEVRRGGRALPGARPRLAVRDRRRQRPRAVHPHGQVPGADRRRPRARPRHRRRARRRRPARPAWCSATRRWRPSATRSETAEEAGIDVEIVDVETSGNAGGSFWGRNAPGTSRLVIDKQRGVDRRRHVHRRRGPGLPPRGDDRDRRRGPRRAPAPRRPGVPDAQRDLAQPAREVRGVAGLKRK